MVKLFFIGIFYKRENNSVVQLKTATDLSSFGFFQRNSVAEFMKFTAKTVVERCEIATRTSIKQQGLFDLFWIAFKLIICSIIF